MNPNQKIIELTKKLNHYNFQYYMKATSEVSDQEFDLLLKELETLEEKHPEYILDESPTHRVGGTITKDFETVKHRVPMLSLSNTYNEEELIEWDARIKKLMENETYEFICEIKFDGISLSLTYKNGVLQQGLTRGDGQQGDNITANVKTIRSLPLKTSIESDFEVRGEGFLPIKEFDRINEEREAEGLEPHANPRNTASGTFKMQDSSVVASRKLDCYVYEYLAEEKQYATHEESLFALKKAGFNISPTWAKAKNIDEVIDFIRSWEIKRHELDCATDGIVIKINNFEQREFLGFTAKSPRWAIAYKYKAESKSTTLLDVTYQVGRTGAVTPVAELEPVELSQTTVRRATLHNADEVERLGLRIGDSVFVEKAGEIIPKVTGVNHSKKRGEQPVVFPEVCPACQSPIYRKEGEAAYYCPNEKGCLPQIKGRIEHFIQRKAMNIDSLGGGKIEIILEHELIKDAADLYKLTFEDLIGREKVHIDEVSGKERKVSFKQKTVENILLGLENSKKEPFYKVLYGMGIRYVGITTAEKLANSFKSIDAIKNATFEELIAVHDVGDKVAESLIAYFKEEENLEFVNKLKESKLQLIAENTEVALDSTSLSGLKILYTGTFKNYTRKELEETIKANGGKLISSISKNLNYLIVGENAGSSKLDKATKLKVPMISESEFEELISKSV